MSTLFAELRSVLTDEFEGYTQESVLPEITVTKLDDIPSGLCLLKEYIMTMSEDITDSTHKSHEVIKGLRQQLTETKKQLKESRELTMAKQAQLASSQKTVDTLMEEKANLKKESAKQEEEVCLLVGTMRKKWD